MNNEIVTAGSNSEEIYTSIRSFVITAQNRVYAAINSAMVIAYWEIGEQIYKACQRATVRYSHQSISPTSRQRKN